MSVRRLEGIPGFNIDRVAAAAGNDPDVLRLENLDTDIPPPAEAELCVAQLVPLLEPPEEPDDEQPAASRDAAATPASASRYEDLTSAS